MYTTPRAIQFTMMTRALLCVVVVTVIALIAVFAFIAYRATHPREDFANIDEKVAHLREWIETRPRSPYTEYIAANPDSNIVEYARLRQLQSQRMLHDTRALRNALRI